MGCFINPGVKRLHRLHSGSIKKMKILQDFLIYFLLCKWIYYHYYYYLVIFSCITYNHQVVSLTNHAISYNIINI